MTSGNVLRMFWKTASIKPLVSGLPKPHCLDVPRSLESIIRAQGAVPATIGIVGGQIKVGLDDQDLQRLAYGLSNVQRWKVSRRDISAAVQKEC